jgi:CDP-diacylglycerol--serine O-phosphatidyltransferase
MNPRRIVPNSISGLSLVLGVLSIFLTLKHDFFWSAIFIILAVCADSCDGRAARLLNCQGEFGKELDSLCDVCSFGMAPAVLIYVYSLEPLGILGQIIASLFTFGGAMRLARFNINSSNVHGYFQGMPIPAGACVVATYVVSGFNFAAPFVAVGTLIVAVIMYSEVRYPDFKGKGNPLFKAPVICAAVIGLYMLFTNLGGWPFICMFTYTICGIINWIYVIAFHKTYEQ